MAMTAGSPPTLGGLLTPGSLSALIYDTKVAQGIYNPNVISETIGSTTFSETTAEKNARVLNNMKECYAEALATISHIQSNGVVNTVLTGTAGGDPITGTGLGGVT
jgi:hypothetical protein